MKIDKDDERSIRIILKTFYGTSADRININDKVFIEIVKLLQASELCTNVLHFVPRPALIGNPVKWLEKHMRKSVLRFLTTEENKHYLVCLKISALTNKTRIEMASQGLL